MKAIFLSLAIVAASSAAALAADYSGTWEVVVLEAGHKNYYLPMTSGRLEIASGGASARFNQLTFTGRLQKDGLHLECVVRGAPCGELTVQADGGRLAGKGSLLDVSRLERPVTLEGQRPAPRRQARTFDYEPTQFSNHYSPTLTAALRLQPGDTVRTRTLDSRGQDRDGKPRAPRGNPLIGPFFVEGAMPGDTLVVRLDKVRTNRDTAYQTNLINSNALEAGYLHGIANLEEGFTSWKIDAAAGTASIVAPSSKMSGYTIKLEPMLGSIAVAAPNDENRTSGYIGAAGGNMDSPEVREGATLYFPVFQPGALLYMGDAHAQQGDGEITGQGLETSMDVNFTVDLIPGKALRQVRLENADYVMIMGTGLTMEAATQSATTEMSRWLADAYGLSPHDIAQFLGTAIQYEIPEVVDGTADVIAKVRKDAMAKLRR
jgi:amidase